MSALFWALFQGQSSMHVRGAGSACDAREARARESAPELYSDQISRSSSVVYPLL